ncbi:non-ribosomal peptide synthetase [Rouxiella chamberiensis]|uniref:non-ribosomal peptide synthetase n=1 Tax=Rouxiella chamberiensis TaxID=1513468 RepID=UPI0005D38AC4|nr:non-ribosomal peptide synthetase [Rouxiella chamberiensis]
MTLMQEETRLSRKDAARKYWQTYLAGAQRTRNAALQGVGDEVDSSSHEAGRVTVDMAPDVNRALLALVKQASITLDVLLSAAWSLLLAKYSGEDEVLFGQRIVSSLTGERQALPLRIAIDGHLALGEWFCALTTRLDAHRDHAEIDEQDLLRAAGKTAEQPLFDSLIAVSETQERDAMDDAPVQLTLHAGVTLSLELSYRAGEISHHDALEILHRLQRLLTSFTQGTTRTLREQTMLDTHEIDRVLHHWNATALELDLQRSLYALFEDQVAARQDARALVAEDACLSYRQLADRAAQIAAGLQQAGVAQGDRVVLSMEKTPDLIAAMLGIIKLGAAYVPIALDAPRERRAFILEDAEVRWTLTTQASRASFAEEESGNLLFVDDFIANDRTDETHVATAAVDSQTIAYIIYTSGTTGTPKGVEISHRNLINFCGWCEDLGIFSAGQPIMQFAPYTFDASAGEIFGTLTRGCELHLLSNALIQNPPALSEYLNAHDIRFAAFPPPYLAHLDPSRVPEGMTLLTAGSAPTPALIERWSERCRYINGYGPTETTIMSSAWMRDAEPQQDNRLSIGRPIANTRMYVVDTLGQLCAPGMAGEIWIGGEGVAVGYVNRPDLTAKHFIADPWVAGGRVYRTGDIGRWFEDGRIEFLGRRDHQIKLSGYRIELGEIESRLAALPQVKEATVVGLTVDGGEPRLVAYVVPHEVCGNEVIGPWREILATQLPSYMIPAAFVMLSSLPLTANGKIDRKALPQPDSRAYLQRDFDAPHRGIETTLAQLWQEMLGVGEVGRQDNFFELGGSSLLAMQLRIKLRDLNLYTDVPTLFAYPVLADLATHIALEPPVCAEKAVPATLLTPETPSLHPALFPLVSLTQPQLDSLVARVSGGLGNIQDIYALAPIQEGILFHHLLEQQGDPYLQCGHLSFAQRTTLDNYLDAVQRVIERHDVLRTAFIWQGLEKPVQVVLRHACLHVEEVNLDAAQGSIVEQLKARHAPESHRIDLAQPPLLKMVVAYDREQDVWQALMYLHHLVEDLASLQILLADIQAFLTGKGSSLPPAVPFRHHVAALQGQDNTDAQRAFFGAMLADVSEPTVPFNLKGGHLQGLRIIETRQTLDATWVQRLRYQARRLGVGVSSLCHLSWARVMGAISGRETVVFGTVLSGRMQGEGSEQILGPCINTLPLRLDVGQGAVEDAVRLTHQRLSALIKHEHATLSLAQQCSGIVSPTPMFSAVLNYRHNRPTDIDVLGPIEQDGVTWHGFEERTHYPVTASIDEVGNQLEVGIQAVESLSSARIAGYFTESIHSLVAALEAAMPPASASISLHQLNVLPADERQRLLGDFNATALPFPNAATIHSLFEQQAEKQPHAVALRMGEVRLSYAELNQRANQLAHRLIALGVGPDVCVAVCIDRSETLLIALLATLKAGGAYVPLDPDYPAARLAYILEDARPKALLVDARGSQVLTAESAPSLTCLNLDDEAQSLAVLPATNPRVAALTSAHLAYVIYTSGSTGQPKGVMVEHRQVGNFLTGMQALFNLTPKDCLLSVTSISFDIAGLELYLPLMTGASILLASRSQARDPYALLVLLQDAAISIMQATPTTWRALVDADATPHPQLKILCGGEALPSDLARRLHVFGESLWNLYGPTETTIWSTCQRVEADDVDRYNQAIGRPVANTQVYLLDANGHPVPLGAIGELYIGGDGVTRGYHARPELTAERFIADPFSRDPEARLYRTGDFAQFMADGRLIYLGRTDSQLKLRGHRIELQEIEARLQSHALVREAVVVARDDLAGATRLVAYVVPRSLEERAEDHAPATDNLDFSLFFFGATSDARQGYQDFAEAAEFGDQHGFTAIWTPERHFHSVGGLYANPALLHASLASRTRNIQLRAGSVVLPLHDPVTIAENWSIVDNLSNGRVGVGIASGWNQQDFVLAPHNYRARRDVMRQSIDALNTLWQGGSVTRLDSHDNEIAVEIYPKPVQKSLPLWITAAGTSETFAYAGSTGANVLTHMLTQNMQGLADHIDIYRAAREKAGYDPLTGTVTVMIHTYLGADHDEVLQQAKGPFLDYLQGHLSLLSCWLKEQDINLEALGEDDKRSLLEFAFKRYTRELSFIGTPESALAVAEQLREIGVNEVACLVDWLVPENAQSALTHLATFKSRVQSLFGRKTLRRHLQETLPDYMVPAAFVMLDALPLTPNGKIDRNALVAPDDVAFARRAYTPPQGSIETTMALLWEELLGVPQVGRQDHFFELGGYSLLAVRLIEQLRRKGLSIEIRTLFDTPVLADLAAKTLELAETRL